MSRVFAHVVLVTGAWRGRAIAPPAQPGDSPRWVAATRLDIYDPIFPPGLKGQCFEPKEQHLLYIHDVDRFAWPKNAWAMAAESAWKDKETEVNPKKFSEHRTDFEIVDHRALVFPNAIGEWKLHDDSTAALRATLFDPSWSGERPKQYIGDPDAYIARAIQTEIVRDGKDPKPWKVTQSVESFSGTTETIEVANPAPTPDIYVAQLFGLKKRDWANARSP